MVYSCWKKDTALEIKHVPLDIIKTSSYYFDGEDKTPLEVEQEILKTVTDFKDKIITLRIKGCLASGKISDINFKGIFEQFKDAYHVLKNTSKLTTKEFKEIAIDSRNVDEIEHSLIKEHLEQSILPEEKFIALMHALDKEKLEGEKIVDFEGRVIKESSLVIDL